MTYVADPNGQSFRPAIDVRLDLGAVAADIAEVQGRIKEAFYANLLLMMAESDRRARDRRAARGEDADAEPGAEVRTLATAISFGIDHPPILAVQRQGRAGRGLSNPSSPQSRWGDAYEYTSYEHVRLPCRDPSSVDLPAHKQ